ncbi:thioredoxin domain-containing protein 12-like [Neodiprion fabricii]|uniref:thioredoxin domain-containing protein 12-like n=1 Tax=Neodiprion fabricii TaxID=2872261 RepID=UPI001ED94535|nr:thioredoxin domain-containing protein 12-like [Neodiprion fabricii]
MKIRIVPLVPVTLLHLPAIVVARVIAQDSGNENSGDHGFGLSYRWRSVSGGFTEAKKTRKPIMVVVHKLGCPACANLRPKFANSLKLLDLSQHFVMVNVEASGEKQLPDKFVPDGAYVPRILFFCPDGKLLREIDNQDPNREPNYKYHYWNVGQIVDSMFRVLKMFPQMSTHCYPTCRTEFKRQDL